MFGERGIVWDDRNEILWSLGVTCEAIREEERYD